MKPIKISDTIANGAGEFIPLNDDNHDFKRFVMLLELANSVEDVLVIDKNDPDYIKLNDKIKKSKR